VFEERFVEPCPITGIAYVRELWAVDCKQDLRVSAVVMKSSISRNIMPCSPLKFSGLQDISQKIELFNGL
jgi:hypothetical protein